MSEMSAANDVPAAPAPEAPEEPTVAPAGGGGEVWVVGYVAATDEPVLSNVQDATDTDEVWLESTPDARQTLADLDDAMGEGGVEWLAEPTPFQNGAPAPAAPPAAPVAAAGIMSEEDILDDLEAQVAALEGRIAEFMESSLEDERFAEQDAAVSPMGRVAAMFAEARRLAEARIAAAAPSAEDEVEVGDDLDAVAAEDEVAADGEEPDPAEDEVGRRYADLTRRIERLDATIAGLMDEAVVDEPLLAPEDVDKAVIDERDARVAADDMIDDEVPEEAPPVDGEDVVADETDDDEDPEAKVAGIMCAKTGGMVDAPCADCPGTCGG